MKYYLIVFGLCVVKDFMATAQVYLISKLNYLAVVMAATTTLITWAMTVVIIMREDRLPLIATMTLADVTSTFLLLWLARKGVQRA